MNDSFIEEYKKILNDKTKFNYVKEDPLKEKNWIINAKLRHLL